MDRILEIKDRDPAQGLILIASRVEQLEEWIDLDDAASRLTSSSEHPITWIVPAADWVPFRIRGAHTGIAVRITTHAVAAALCDAADSALVSTSANVAGQPPARNRYVLRRHFGTLVDFIVPGDCGPAAGPSEIRDLVTGKTIRSGSS